MNINKVLTGYAINRYPDDIDFHKIRDLSLFATPEVLKDLALFFNYAADEMLKNKDTMTDEWHQHFRDYSVSWNEEMIDVIISASL